MNENYMAVVQLPKISENLMAVKAAIEKRTSEAMKLAVTEDTRKAVKCIRTDMNAEFGSYEARRKEIKKQLLEPYETFEKTYNECVKAPYKDALQALDSKISDVEGGIKAEKEVAVKKLFDGLIASSGLDWLTFERAGLNITLSASQKSLNDAAITFVNRVAADVAAIRGMVDCVEIMVEYKKTLDLPGAIKTVHDRNMAKAAEAVLAKTVPAVEAAVPVAAPVVARDGGVVLYSDETTAGPVYCGPSFMPAFTTKPNEELQVYVVRAKNAAQCAILEAFLNRGGFEFKKEVGTGV